MSRKVCALSCAPTLAQLTHKAIDQMGDFRLDKWLTLDEPCLLYAIAIFDIVCYAKRGMLLLAMFNYIGAFRAFQDLMLMSFA